MAVSLQLVPSASQFSLGSNFTVDIVIAGLEAEVPAQIVSAFDLDVLYDSTVLQATGAGFGTPGAVWS